LSHVLSVSLKSCAATLLCSQRVVKVLVQVISLERPEFLQISLGFQPTTVNTVFQVVFKEM